MSCLVSGLVSKIETEIRSAYRYTRIGNHTMIVVLPCPYRKQRGSDRPILSPHTLSPSLSLSRPGRVRIEVLADFFFFFVFVGVYTIITIFVLAFPLGELAT